MFAFFSFNLSILLVLECATLALAAPQNIPAPTPTLAPSPSSPPSVPTPIATLSVNLGPNITNCLDPILDISDDGVAIGGIGCHEILSFISEHGNGVLTVGSDEVDVVLTQTFDIFGAVVSYGLAIVLPLQTASDSAPTPTPT
ncbi:hypothetical protein BT96DRAFT_924701 [Gymnopus androsaceus JB14]|uniref:Hydrophobin n=1 Tax=Gymnopus androsaceus JB14 TaxID=1447944 RepID=A0A6A4H3W1_9AGAR|nr:hypothetical protein BT96DRAFT_924701 [Gymnopus androsaceus JB14]